MSDIIIVLRSQWMTDLVEVGLVLLMLGAMSIEMVTLGEFVIGLFVWLAGCKIERAILGDKNQDMLTDVV